MTATPVRPCEDLPLMQFNFETKPEGDVAAYLPVRWCVDPTRLLQQIKDRGYKKPHLLICIQHRQVVQTYGDHTTLRVTDTNYFVAPLEQELQYVSFRKPGNNRVLAVIVDADNSDTAAALYKLRRATSAPVEYDSLFHETGAANDSAFRKLYISSRIETHVSQDVEVDAEMFAPEPAAWRKSMVRAFFRGRESDQCHFRKRFLTVIGLLALLWIPVKVIQLLLALVSTVFLGMPDVDYREVFRPLSLAPNAPVKRAEVRDSVYLRYFPLWVLNPTVLLVPASVVWFFADGKWGYWSTVLTVDLWIVGVALVLGIIAGLTLLTVNIVRKRRGSASYQEQRRQRKLEADRRRQAALEASVQAMSCTIGDKTASVDALPAEKQTVRLKFYRLKGAVCRPFAG